MIVVKTVVKPSKIHGLGLFADQFIPKGAAVWIFNPLVDIVYTKKQIKSFPKVFREFLSVYSYEIKNGSRVLSADGDRFINHCDKPNVVAANDKKDVALRDILIGEELTLDYYSFDEETSRLNSISKTDLT